LWYSGLAEITSETMCNKPLSKVGPLASYWTANPTG